MGWGKFTVMTHISNVQHARREISKQLNDPEAAIEVLETSRRLGRTCLECKTGCAPLTCDWCDGDACPGCGANPILKVTAGASQIDRIACARPLCRLKFHIGWPFLALPPDGEEES